MRRIYLATLAALLFLGALLIFPVNRSFVARADVSEGERLAMYSKPAVVRIIDGICRTICVSLSEKRDAYFQRLLYRLGLRFFSQFKRLHRHQCPRRQHHARRRRQSERDALCAID